MTRARSQKALPVTEWPELDREAWSLANQAGDEISGWGTATEWAPRSIENAEQAVGRFLGFLARNDRLRPVSRVGERVVLENLRAFGYGLSAQLAPYTVLGIFASLNMAFAAMDPTADRSLLNKLISRLARSAKSVRDIGSNLLSPKELETIGRSMMEEAEKQTCRSRRRASLYRDGLLTMFLALCPLRPGAVAEMQIGTHLLVQGSRVVVHLPPDERKKRRLQDVPLPDELMHGIVRYLECYRSMFPRPAPEHAKAVWISSNGNAFDRGGISRQIKIQMARRTDKQFSAHMFRHACATYIVDVAPERARMIVGVLGHAGFRTAKRHYIKGQQHMAVKKHQEAVRDLMRRGRSRRTHRSRGPSRSKRRGRKE